MQAFYAEFHPTRTINVENTEGNKITCRICLLSGNELPESFCGCFQTFQAISDTGYWVLGFSTRKLRAGVVEEEVQVTEVQE